LDEDRDTGALVTPGSLTLLQSASKKATDQAATIATNQKRTLLRSQIGTALVRFRYLGARHDSFSPVIEHSKTQRRLLRSVSQFARLTISLAQDPALPRRSPLGRRQLETDDVAHFLDKQRVGGEFEGFGAMGLEVERFPDPMNGRGREARGFRHRSQAPEFCVER
jgi:hypothetical protein